MCLSLSLVSEDVHGQQNHDSPQLVLREMTCGVQFQFGLCAE